AASALDIVHARHEITAPHRLAEIEYELDEAAAQGADIAVGVGHIEKRGGSALELASEHARMDQQVAHTTLGNGNRLGSCRAAAAELGGDEGLAQLLRGRVIGSDRIELAQHH